ncbi:cysteine desulfurase family protein [Aureimonas leprariae]|uniref:Cysteine desulfurase n=1 Tax=Plantimonas leprariae TaxID=2615207 RepID=A0A7V7PS20_9HYPH|nr:aminotransferase class V-fold PLP-dependent enzyme [Aureimonas leprariae]KAB0681811.1 aminotransferase class V-fold PLP-dependent enzyme [Aureimonas leprariae]
MFSSRRRVYLDYNATHPLLAEARAALVDSLELYGNPSSVHDEGRRARAAVEAARRDVARLVGASPEDVVFTGSATEAAVTCLTPRWVRDGREIAVEALAVCDADHPATREGGQFPPEAVTRLAVDASGIVDMRALEQWLAGLGGRTGMLALGLANGETGVVQPLDEVRTAFAGRDVILVLDAVQAAGRMPLAIGELGADALVLSGHKIGAAKGVGALVLGRESLRPFRLLPGGGQEHGMRSGTEAVPSIVSFGAAARIAAERASSGGSYFRALRERIVERLRAEECNFTVVGEVAARLDNTLAIVAPGVKAETAQIALDLEGFAVSAGSACASGKVGTNHVLAAMAAGGLAVDPAMGLVRVSLGTDTTEVDADAFSASFAKIVRRAQESMRARRAA